MPLPDKPISELLTWIESEIKANDEKLTKADGYGIIEGYFARIRKLKFAREIILEYLKTI